MKMMLKLILAGCLLCSLQAGAEIYKWRDEKGVMNYSDVPPQAGANSTQKIKAATVPNDIPLTRSDAYQREEGASNSKRSLDNREAVGNGQSAEAEALKAMQERLKAQNCAAARSNYRNYAVGGRMQNVNENGQKEYLTDDQIREGQARAQQEIDENCPVE
ncbi:DUF4124 domain-containing protein [Methylophilus sp. UBA6697]|jgi:hypothetical protein|uniref:DUF4124 domain-containing protein n=1 Tax=Methylophilus sp. UBA6697 TaxID=1946902 RepID=UPI000EE940F1|nr:DUF4124 domain-containing protein [Methylophilus sp. UBA6697]HCU85211.1 DUF4124 domain-containing protein [Methylophilus sp.]